MKADGADVPELKSFAEYKAAARSFFSGSGEGLEQGFRADGALVRLDTQTGYFGVMTPDGVIKTFFKPVDPVEYFKSQF